MNPVLRKKLEILVLLALADKEFAHREKKFIESICVRHEVSPEILEDIIRQPGDVGSLGALSYPKSVEYLTDCILLMLVDGKVLPGEVLFCQDIAMRLGFSKMATDELLTLVSEVKTIDREKLIRQVEELPHIMK